MKILLFATATLILSAPNKKKNPKKIKKKNVENVENDV